MCKNVVAIFLLLFFFGKIDFSGAGNITVNLQTTFIDGSTAPYSKLVAGDTVFLMAGERDFLLIRNFQGKKDKPFVFINQSGIVRINTSHNFGISVQNCEYFRITGTGDKSNFYGIQIDRVENGAGIGIGGLSSDFELDHISIKNVPIAGIYAKTDPDCSTPSTREKFTQKNTSIHDVLIENAGNEGIYAGSTGWFGQTVSCNGKDTLLLPALLDGVKIYRNIIKNSGWDGIQVSSASNNCAVYENQIYNDSQAEYTNQMSGILLGGGSKCDCYNNLIIDGKGDGIENHGLGGNMIFNNVIVNAGKTFYPDDHDASKMKHAIFVSDVSTLSDTSYFILNNTIINPKSDGIRFASSKSKGNLIASNAIINPGNFDYYENGNTQFSGTDSYIMIPDKQSDVSIQNNFFSRILDTAKLNDDYSLLAGSPLIDAGYAGSPQISFDFLYNDRPVNVTPDIGAYEFQQNTAIISTFQDNKLCKVFPNPANDMIYISFQNFTNSEIEMKIYNLSGSLVFQKKINEIAKNSAQQVSIKEWEQGLYFLSILSNGQNFNTKFLKTD